MERTIPGWAIAMALIILLLVVLLVQSLRGMI